MSDDFKFEADIKADHETGFDDNGPTLSTLANAIQCWSITNDAQRRREIGSKHSGVTVAEAALAFAVPVERAIQAVEYHYWMFLTGDGPDGIIEHEGE